MSRVGSDEAPGPLLLRASRDGRGRGLRDVLVEGPLVRQVELPVEGVGVLASAEE